MNFKCTFFILHTIMAVRSLHNWRADPTFLQTLSKNDIGDVSQSAGSHVGQWERAVKCIFRICTPITHIFLSGCSVDQIGLILWGIFEIYSVWNEFAFLTHCCGLGTWLLSLPIDPRGALHTQTREMFQFIQAHPIRAVFVYSTIEITVLH